MLYRQLVAAPPSMIHGPMADDHRNVLHEVGQQLKAYLEFERQMATPGLPPMLPQVAVPYSGTAAPTGRSRAIVDGPAPPDGPAPDAAAPVPAIPADLPPAERVARLRVLAEQAAACTDCVLHERRHRNVFARGNPAAELVFVGEGPGRDEDQQGLPFVGAAGQLLDKMVAAMGYARDDVYICNVVKCRPPENRTPRPEEAIACSRFLRPQLALVAPKLIVALGRCAAEHLGVARPEGPWRGRWGEYAGIAVMPTYHPAFLLRSPQFKRVVWEDLQKVMATLGRAPAPKR